MDAAGVAALARQREAADGPFMEAARRISVAYDGHMVVPVPKGLSKAAVANTIRQGIDHVGMRVADPPESIKVVPMKTGPRPEAAAEKQRRALLGLLEEDEYDLTKRERARHLVGYSRSPVLIRPDMECGHPTFEAIEPLRFLAGPRDRMVCKSPIVVTTRDYAWIAENYPAQAHMIWKGYRWRDMADADKEQMRFRIYRYETPQRCMVVLGTQADRSQDPAPIAGDGQPTAVLLEDYENLAGCPTAVMPDLITLTSGGLSVFDQMIGMYEGRATLTALSIEAVKRGVFQDEWLVGDDPMRVPEVIQVPDPSVGQIGIVKAGKIMPRQVDPQFMQNTAVDRMEQAERATGGIPVEFGGQSGSNVRTGRRGSQVLSSTVDFPVAEAQAIMGRSLQHELEIAAKVDKGWFKGQKRRWAVEWKGAQGIVEYDPGEMYQTEPKIRVSHPVPGVDQADLVVLAGQKIGMGTMAKRDLMEIDPMVQDVERTMDRINEERLFEAFWSSVMTLASNPEGPLQPVDFANLARKINVENIDPYEAYQQVQEEAQQRQAQQVPAGAPEAMPGMSMPGMGAEAGMAIQDPSQSMPSTGNLTELIAGLTGAQHYGGVR